MANLRSLHMSNNRLAGPIPKSLGSLSSLQVLDLSHNLLTGHIPTFIGKLTKLDLSYNPLNGSIPESFTRLEDLTQLVLNNNMLTGFIPSSIGRLVSLQEFSVSSNLLNGNIPISVGQLTKLQSLGLSENSLKGVVSKAHFVNLLMLKHMDLSSNNNLTFNVSRAWMPPFQLVTLDLSSSKIEDGFPQWLRMQRRLVRLSLSNASISGPLPEWFRKMPISPFLKLSHNKLSGPLTNLPDVETVTDVAYQFSRAFLLQNDLFNKSILQSFCKSKNIYAIQLSGNRLTGKIPNCLGDLQKLGVLILSKNALSGVIPISLRNCSSLKWLS
ncbi:hypothetical protein L1987_55104 [Smallanthus sonchifolius]|uniref:Uncharacterized protein n=1 Tax=Smallanthus sonchifolius TaxID=185202 RepID=A0ACB9E9P7_9ASTR|nr:hypothetical protein L1987_55104 [Smallanthus sonchifolius]